MQIYKSTNSKGLSLVEILVVIGIFAILGVLTTRAVILTLAGGQKAETTIRVRENVNYAFGVIQRQLRNADSIVDCTNTDTSQITYLDQNSQPASFACKNIGVGIIGYIASNSAQLTSSGIDLNSCSFVCKLGTSGNPSSVVVSVAAKDTNINGIVITSSTSVSLRNY